MAACRSTAFFCTKAQKSKHGGGNLRIFAAADKASGGGRAVAQSLPGEGGFVVERIDGSECRDPDSPDSQEPRGTTAEWRQTSCRDCGMPSPGAAGFGNIRRSTKRVEPDAPWRSPYQARADLRWIGSTARSAVTPTAQIRKSREGRPLNGAKRAVGTAACRVRVQQGSVTSGDPQSEWSRTCRGTVPTRRGWVCGGSDQRLGVP